MTLTKHTTSKLSGSRWKAAVEKAFELMSKYKVTFDICGTAPVSWLSAKST